MTLSFRRIAHSRSRKPGRRLEARGGGEGSLAVIQVRHSSEGGAARRGAPFGLWDQVYDAMLVMALRADNITAMSVDGFGRQMR